MNPIALRNLVFVGATFVLALVTASVSAQSPAPAKNPPAKARSLDQQLLDDLDRELLKGLPAGTKPAPLAPSPDRKPPANETADNSQNPLANLAQRMRTVENRIAQHDTSAKTQAEQGQILSELDTLLEEAKKAQQAGKNQSVKGGGNAQVGTGNGAAAPGPPRDSTNRIERGTKEQAETADVKDVLRRIWGHLPEKLRDEMQASLSEQFLPKYERLIEEYYKRLAEERPSAP